MKRSSKSDSLRDEELHDELDDEEELDEVELLEETDEDRWLLFTRLPFFLATLLSLSGLDSDVIARSVPMKFITICAASTPYLTPLRDLLFRTGFNIVNL